MDQVCNCDDKRCILWICPKHGYTVSSSCDESSILKTDLTKKTDNDFSTKTPSPNEIKDSISFFDGMVVPGCPFLKIPDRD